MSYKQGLFLISLIPTVYALIRMGLTDRKRKEPLPEEVADIYDEERWKTFLAEKHDLRIPALIDLGTGVLSRAILLFSPLLSYLESITDSVFVLTLSTAVLLFLLEWLLHFPTHYYREMVIGTKYELNHKDIGEFLKDELMEEAFSFGLTMGMYLVAVLIFENIRSLTHDFGISWPYCLIGAVCLAGICFAFVTMASWISWQVMRKQYTFTEMEEGELKDRIMALTVGAKKKIRKIEVYNESVKSNSKNAFLFRFLGYRSFGIADNFLKENEEKELLAVLSHEAGHLKHKKNLLNYLSYVLGVFAVLGISFLIPMGGRISLQVHHVLLKGFSLHMMNYVLILEMIGWVTEPVMFLLSVFFSYRTRTEEYEADRNAVKEGYGEELIRTFKTLSKDELVDVNPHPWIEMTEFSHPGMYSRIRAIHKEMENMTK